MASGTLAPSPYITVLDSNGNPVAGAKIYTYAAGTTTPITTYSDAALTVANANPIVADAAGRYTAYLVPGTGYRFDIKTSADVSIDSVDNILGVPSSASTIDVVGTAGVSITAGQTVYLSTGTGGAPTAGKWYLADADNTYSSTLPIVGIAVDSIALNATGTIRLAGAVSNPSVEGGGTLTIGNTYYISTTAGSITTTAPANAKVIGLAQSSTTLVVSYQSPVSLPLTVVDGGTGQSTLTTAYGVLTAGTSATGPIQTLVPGTANKMLISGGSSAVPTWSWYSNPSEYDNGNSGTAKTIDFSANGPVQKLTRTANTTLTLTAPPVPSMTVLKTIHESTTLTISIASPAVVTKTAHGLSAGNTVVFATTGALPTGLTAGTTYYVIATGLTANAFQVSATLGGSAINTSGSQSGTHTLAYTVTFSPVPKWPGGTAMTFTNTASGTDIVTLYWDGATWYASGQANFS